MPNYFNHFPTTYYTNDTYNKTQLDIVTDITKRLGFEQSLLTNASTYLQFVIGDGDTPESIAHKYYGDVEKHWIVLMMNSIMDPQYDWPLSQRGIIKFINDKYTANASVGQTGLQWAQSNNHSYYKIETRTSQKYGTVTTDTVQLDANTYANVAVSTTSYTLQDGQALDVVVTKEAKTYYDYELDKNEKRRTINLLRKEYVPMVMDELKTIFNMRV